MRTHARFSTFVHTQDESFLRDAVRPAALVAARLEPVVRGLRGGACLDLAFSLDGRIAVVPFIEIAPEELEERELSPLIWPRAIARAVDGEQACALEDLLVPWIESHTLGRQLTQEVVRVFGGAQLHDLFEAARAARFLGAVPYRTLVIDAAPYVYAARFAQSKRVLVRDPHGSTGALLLRRYARAIECDLMDPALNALAQRWYGSALRFEPASRACDVAVCAAGVQRAEAEVGVLLDAEAPGSSIAIATPVPTDVMVSFDLQDAPAVRHIAVQSAQRRQLRPTLAGGAPKAEGSSAGRILLGLRSDWRTRSDGDVDDARDLAEMLRAQGFTVEVESAANAEAASYDLVHVFGAVNAREFLPLAQAAARAAVPFVLTAGFEDAAGTAAWGAGIVSAMLRVVRDETDLEDHLAMLTARHLEAPGLSAKPQAPFAGYEESVRAMLGSAKAVLASGDAERTLMQRFGFAAPASAAPSYVLAGPEPADLNAVLGELEFVLVHAPIEPRCNQFLLLRAAMNLRLPVVLAGPIVDPEYYGLLRENAGEQVVFLPDADEAEMQTLYRSARVFADLGWLRYSPHRSARAAISGCALAVSRDAAACSLWGAQGLWRADPAEVKSIETAIGDAWIHARENRAAIDELGRRVAALCEPRAALVSTLQAYSAAQTAGSSAAPSR